MNAFTMRVVVRASRDFRFFGSASSGKWIPVALVKWVIHACITTTMVCAVRLYGFALSLVTVPLTL